MYYLKSPFNIYIYIYNFLGVCELNGKIYCIGGWNGQVGIKQSDVYDPNTNKWTSIAPLQTGKKN